MNRFKFRCWDSNTKKMFYPDVFSHNINLGLSVKYLYDYKEDIIVPVVSDNIVLMQWSGLKDSYGTDIFEGDVVEVGRPGNNYTIEYRGTGMWFTDEEGSGFVFTHPQYDIKVIGNIYE